MTMQPSPYSQAPKSYAQGRADERARWERVLRNPLAVASAIDTQVVIAHLDARGWTRCASLRPDVGVWCSDNGFEVLVPLDRTLTDRAAAIVRAAGEVADLEHRLREAVLLDWLDATEASRG